jgi:hypothetical protein
MSDRISVNVDERWKVGVDPAQYSKYRTGAAPWLGELVIRTTFDTAQVADSDDWRDAARLAAAVTWRSYGFAVGEPPHVADEVEQIRPGVVGVKVTGLVTIPPYWTGAPDVLGQAGLWDGGEPA